MDLICPKVIPLFKKSSFICMTECLPVFLPFSESRVAFQVVWGLAPARLGTAAISDWKGGTVPATIPI